MTGETSSHGGPPGMSSGKFFKWDSFKCYFLCSLDRLFDCSSIFNHNQVIFIDCIDRYRLPSIIIDTDFY